MTLPPIYTTLKFTQHNRIHLWSVQANRQHGSSTSLRQTRVSRAQSLATVIKHRRAQCIIRSQFLRLKRSIPRMFRLGKKKTIHGRQRALESNPCRQGRRIINQRQRRIQLGRQSSKQLLSLRYLDHQEEAFRRQHRSLVDIRSGNKTLFLENQAQQLWKKSSRH